MNGLVYSMTAAQVHELANNPEVVYVSLDRKIAATMDYANPAVDAQLALAAGFDGTGVGIALIDSGVTEVKDLDSPGPGLSGRSRVVYSQSFVSGTKSTEDGFGHGTHVAGIVAGNGAKSPPAPDYFKTFQRHRPQT